MTQDAPLTALGFVFVSLAPLRKCGDFFMFDPPLPTFGPTRALTPGAMPRTTELGYFVLYNRPEARRIILDAVTRCDGNVTRAAPVLKTTQRTLRRMIVDLGLDPDIEQIRARLLAEGVINPATSSVKGLEKRKVAKAPRK